MPAGVVPTPVAGAALASCLYCGPASAGKPKLDNGGGCCSDKCGVKFDKMASKPGQQHITDEVTRRRQSGTDTTAFAMDKALQSSKPGAAGASPPASLAVAGAAPKAASPAANSTAGSPLASCLYCGPTIPGGPTKLDNGSGYCSAKCGLKWEKLKPEVHMSVKNRRASGMPTSNGLEVSRDAVRRGSSAAGSPAMLDTGLQQGEGGDASLNELNSFFDNAPLITSRSSNFKWVTILKL
jgi:hypothetical protein